MAAIGGIIMLLGYAVALIGGIWFLIAAFSRHILWGLACLFIPFAQLVFAILNIDVALKPLLLSIAGGVLIFVGAMIHH